MYYINKNGNQLFIILFFVFLLFIFCFQKVFEEIFVHSFSLLSLLCIYLLLLFFSSLKFLTYIVAHLFLFLFNIWKLYFNEFRLLLTNLVTYFLINWFFQFMILFLRNICLFCFFEKEYYKFLSNIALYFVSDGVYYTLNYGLILLLNFDFFDAFFSL